MRRRLEALIETEERGRGMSELPEGWALITLGDIIKVQNGYAFPSKDFRSDGVPLVRQSNLDGNKVSLEKCVYLDESYLETKSTFVLRKDDVLIGMSGSIGKLCIYHLDTPALQNQRTAKIVPVSDKCVSQRFVWEYLKTIERQLSDKGKGLGVLNVSASDIESLPFSLPPLNEQRRIVAKLEKVLSRVDAAQARLATIPRILKRFRQSVLAAACSGKLTTDWRLERLHLPDVSTNAHGDYDLPESWSWRTFKSVSREITVGFVGPMAKEYIESGIPFLRSLNVRPFRFDPTNIKFISENFHRTILKSRLSPGDVAIVRSGNSGVACVIPASLPEANCSDLVILRPDNELDGAYACLFMNSTAAQSHVNSVKVGIAQGHFNVGSMKTTLVPLPPLAEQQEIVRRVEALFATADALEERYRTAKAHVDQLAQAILARAFRGELVPTEAELARLEGRGYEPASALLERIRQARSDQPSNPTETPTAKTKARRKSAKVV